MGTVQRLNVQASDGQALDIRDIQALRTELDELLRARQYAAQRERRLVEALHASAGPGSPHHQQNPDPELLRQLAQVQTLRDGLGARCLEMSERLLAMEDEVRLPSAPAAPPTRRPTGARFGGAYQDTPATLPTTSAPTPPPMTGARFGGGKPAQDRPTAPSPGPSPGPGPGPGPSSRPSPTPSDAPSARSTPSPAQPPLRTSEELTALTERIATLHRRGLAHESAAVTAQAAVVLAPADVVRLAALLRSGGPTGASGYLVRAVAHGAAGQAVGTLAELRRSGQTEEAAELFHALWGYPAAALPALLAALEGVGLAADGLTLLWEWGSAPPAELAGLAVLLRDAGRPEDARTLLRQATGRHLAELAEVALHLDDALAITLIREVLKLRAASDLATFGGALTRRPTRYAALLAAVAELGESHTRSALAALRSAGLPTAVPVGSGPGRRGRR